MLSCQLCLVNHSITAFSYLQLFLALLLILYIIQFKHKVKCPIVIPCDKCKSNFMHLLISRTNDVRRFRLHTWNPHQHGRALGPSLTVASYSLSRYTPVLFLHPADFRWGQFRSRRDNRFCSLPKRCCQHVVSCSRHKL